MKHITTIIALVFAVCIALECQAQRPNRDGEGPRAEGQRGRGQRGPGQRQGPRDPAEMAAQMMKEFDKDGDKKLDNEELAAMFTSMRERRERGQGRPGQGRPGAGEARPERGAGESRPRGREGRLEGRSSQGGESGVTDGVKPKRPATN